ncbi:hypothetical protein C2E23DRAFT_882233 [Lenzites betulinus]|nr:hypothetical protein C2E23DRAFT_882233 [Lenzites betulinus]
MPPGISRTVFLINSYPLWNYKKYRSVATPSECAFLNIDIILLLVDAMPKPAFATTGQLEDTPESRQCRLDLYHLARAATCFFYPAMSAAWESVSISTRVLDMLKLSRWREVGDNWGRSRLGIVLDDLNYLKSTLKHADCSKNPFLRRFRFYAACIKRLKVKINGRDTGPGLLSYIHAHAPQAIRQMFPYLRQLVWIQTEAFILHTSELTPFLRAAPLLNDIALLFDPTYRFASLPNVDEAHRVAVRNAILSQCADVVAEKSMTLRRFTLEAPLYAPIPCTFLRHLEHLDFLDMKLYVTGTAVPPPPTYRSRATPGLPLVVREFEFEWIWDSDMHAIISALSFANLKKLSVGSVFHAPTNTFIADVNLLISHANIHTLSTIDVSSTVLGVTGFPSGNFLQGFAALLSCAQLRYVSISLPGYEFEFTAHDLETLGRAWPALEALNLSFGLTPSDSSPADLQQTIPNIMKFCPHLVYLHVPALATIPRNDEGSFAIAACPRSHLRHLSADVLMLQHGLLDVAFALRWAFPMLLNVGLPSVGTNAGQSDTTWVELNSLLNALQESNFTMILEHTLRFVRDGKYKKIPLSLCFIALMEFVGADSPFVA